MIREIYFAAGCFWATEKLFSEISGVISAPTTMSRPPGATRPARRSSPSSSGRWWRTATQVTVWKVPRPSTGSGSRTSARSTLAPGVPDSRERAWHLLLYWYCLEDIL